MMAVGGDLSGPSLATVLFTDMVDSTSVRTRYGETAADTLRRAHDRLVNDAVSAHSGRLVKTLGDGAMATFPGPSEATNAAMAIQRGVERLNRKGTGPAPLELRVGVSVGEVIWEEDDCFGTPVIEASRLCGAAHGGQILVTELVRMLCGDRAGDVFSPVGQLELKGLGAPVSAYEVSWQARTEESSLPLPVALRTEDRLPFVGRESELQLLRVAWKEAITGDRGAVFVAGEPGIGKTRLVSELAAAAHRDGALVLLGRSDHDVGIPYQPFVEALHYYVSGSTVEELRSVLSPLSGEICRLVPTLAERVPGVAAPMRAEPETERYRLFEAVVDLMSAVTAATPTLLVLDDLHWADHPTLLLLRHLLRSEAPMRLLVVATYRDTDIDAGHPLTQLLTDARREGFGQRLALRGLDPDGVTAMVAAAAEQELGSEATQFALNLHAETDGNAFFVEEVLRHLVETGALVRRGGRWGPQDSIGGLGIPEGVRDITGQRLSRLPHDAQEVLAAAAIIGHEFDIDLLAATAGVPLPEVVSALEAAEMARLIAPVDERPGRFRFAHALVLSAIYDGMATTRRRWLHRAVGLALEARPDRDQRLGELARHFAEAAPLGEVERAVDYARQAGRQAADSLAFERAAEYYERALKALELSPQHDPRLRCDLLMALGENLECAGDESYRPVLFSAADIARNLGDAERLAQAALLFVHLGVVGAMIDPEVLDLMEEALERLGPGDSAERAGLLAGLSTGLLSKHGHAHRLDLSHQAVAMARRVGDPEVLARVLGSQHMVIAGPDAPEEGLRVAREVVALAGQLEKPETAFLGNMLLYTSLVEAGDIDGAEAALGEVERLADELRQPFFAWWALRLRAAQVLFRGYGDEAEGLAEAAYARSRDAGMAEPVIASLFAGQLHLIRHHQGRLHELADLDTSNYPPPMWPVQITRGLALCEAGRADEARPLLEQLAGDDFAAIPRDLLWFEQMVMLAAIARGLGHRQAAGQLYRLLEPYSGRNAWGGNGSLGPVDAALGMLAATLGEHDTAERHLLAAIEQCDRMGAGGWGTFARCDLATTLAERGAPGDRERSQELARRCLEDAQRFGMAGVERRARALLGEGPS